MEPLPRAPVIAFLCGLAVALPACGEKDETDATEAVTTEPTTDATVTAKPAERTPGGPGGKEKLSPQKQIELTVQSVVGGGDVAAACSQLVTPRYVRVAYGDEQGCRAAVEQQKPFDVSVNVIEIEQPGAAANARPQGGPNRGEMLEVRLIEDSQVWRVDYVRSNAPAGP